MLYSMEQVGIRVCPMLNSLIIIATRKVLRWHHLKRCMQKVQDTTVLESNGGKSCLWTRSFATGGEIGTNNKATLEGRTVSTEKLC